MATLVRSGVYDTVEGLTQPQPYGGVGINPQLGSVSSAQFGVTNPVDNYTQSLAQYTTDVRAFGMLASQFGPQVRAAQSIGVNSLYEGASRLTSGNVGAVVDFDLANKQATKGSVAYFRKIGQDQTPTDVGAYNAAQDFLISRRGNTVGTQRILAGRAAEADPYQRYANDVAANKAAHNQNLSGTFGSVQVTQSAQNLPGYNKPNENTFGGSGLYSFGQFDQLAPTSISNGSGAFTGSKISLRTVGPTNIQTFGDTRNALPTSSGITQTRPASQGGNPFGWRSTTLKPQYQSAYNNAVDSANRTRWWG